MALLLTGFDTQAQTWAEVAIITPTDVDCKTIEPGGLNEVTIGNTGPQGEPIVTQISAAQLAQNLPTSGTITGIKFQLIGTIVIDIPLQFDGCEFDCLPGTKIEIQIGPPSGTVFFNNCKLLGCSQMWYGIQVNTHQTLRMSSCLIYGALTAINLKEKSTIALDENRFYNNLVGIFATNESADPTLSVNVSMPVFEGNRFDSGETSTAWAPFLPPYPNMPILPYAAAPALLDDDYLSPLAGVWLESCEGEQLSGVADPNNISDGDKWNTFAYLRNGIMLSNTSTVLQNVQFEGMYANEKALNINFNIEPHIYPNLLGYGVYSQKAGLGNVTLTYQGFLSDPNAPSGLQTVYDFKGSKMSFPIRCERLDEAIIQDVDAESADMAFTLRNCHGNLRVKRNIAPARRRGLNLLGCDGSFVDVSDNTFTVTPHADFPYVASGIHVENTSASGILTGSIGPNNKIYIANNDYSVQAIETKVGIFVLNTSGTAATTPLPIVGNTVNGIGNKRRFIGMRIEGGKFLHVNCNTIVGVSLGSTPPIGAIDFESYPDYSYGFFTLANQRSRFGCNYTDETFEGMTFSGICRGTQLIANDFYDHRIGLHLWASTIFSNQLSGGLLTNNLQQHNGNRWFGLTYSTDRGAWNEVPIPTTTPNEYTRTKFTVKSGSLALNNYRPKDVGSTTNPSIFPATGWFQIQSTTSTKVCSTSVGCNYINPNEVTTTTVDEIELTKLERGIAVDSLEIGVFTEPLSYDAKRSLYDDLKSQPTLAIGDSAFTAFVINMDGNSVGAFYNIDVNIKEDLVNTATQETDLQDIETQINVLADQIAALYAGLAQPPTDAAIAAIRPLLDSIYVDIAALKEEYTILAAGIQAEKDDAADDIKADNNTVSTSEIWEQNVKTVNDIWLTTFAKRNYNLDSLQLDLLYSIATQCPISGGDAVFQARTMYHLAAHDLMYDDKAACDAAGIIMMQRPKKDTDKGEILKGSRETITAAIYPNPASDETMLAFVGVLKKGNIVVTDVLGHKVVERELANTRYATLDVRNLPDGLYIIHLYESGSVIWTKKLLIAH